ncbi:MAG: adenylyl-sulfate kinase [Deltaproteobacteria bacterium]|nr:adenylyl-sulfate kinase [Deltaproteobacteria bacterium]
MYQETHTRSVVKAVSWRVAGTLATSVIVYVFTRRLDIALLAGGVEAVVKLAIYYVHERIWDRIHIGRRPITPAVLWFTGLSGAGKTTLSIALVDELRRRNLRVEHLDGDTIRHIFPKTGFSREEREEHIKRVAYLASRLEKNGVFVVVSLISPYEASRDFARGICENFFEIYLSTPLGECERRDPKGLYRKARSGEVKDFTGITAPYEPPKKPELTIDTSRLSIEQATRDVMAALRKYL